MTFKESKALLQESIAFSPVLGSAFGVCGGLLIQQIHYWCMDRQHSVDGHYWVWNTTREWADQLGVFDERTIKSSLKTLRDLGVVIVGNYNKHRYDKTLWYRIDYDCLRRNLGARVSKSSQFHDPLGNFFTTHSEAISLTIPKTTAETTAETSLALAARTESQPIINLAPGEDPGIHIEEPPMNKVPTSAKAILAAHQVRKNPVKAMNTTGSLQGIWRSEVPKHNDGVNFIPEFTLVEKGQFASIVRNLGQRADTVTTAVVRDWVGFSKFVAEQSGIKTVPLVPHIGFLLKHVGASANYVSGKQAVHSAGKKAVQLIATPTKKVSGNPFKEKDVASVEDLKGWDNA
jgi:hypothetical protein